MVARGTKRPTGDEWRGILRAVKFLIDHLGSLTWACNEMLNSAAILKVDARLLVVPLGPRRECRGGQRATRGKNIIYYSINSMWVSGISPVLHLWIRCYWPVVTRGIYRLQGPTKFWWIAPRRFRPSKDKKPQKRGNKREHHNAAHGTAHDRWSIGLRRRRRWWW